MLKKTLLQSLACIAFVVSGCNKFGDLNKNPNGAETPVTSALLTNVLSQVVNIAANANTTPYYVQYFSQVLYPDYQLYSLQNVGWDDLYAGPLEDLQNCINTNLSDPNPTAAGGNTVNQVQIARILKAYYFMTLTDRYGDIPYSEALKGKATPKYDKQQDIYNDLFKELKESIAAFQSSGFPIKGDIVYNGDISKWKRFANSLRMAMALNLSKVDPVKGKAEFVAALNDPAGYINDNTQNFKISYPGSGFNNPFFNLAGASQIAISATFADKLKSYNDPRVSAYGQPNTSGIVKGIPYGLNRANVQAFTVANPDWSPILNPNWKKNTSPIVILSSAYLDLIRAEAALIYNTGEDAFALYKQGIMDSWAQWNVTGDINVYLSSVGVTTLANVTVDKVAEQVWFSLYESSMFAWNEWRRTGVPVLSPAPDAAGLTIPRRYGYPLTERNFNAANYETAVAAMPYGGGDKTTSRIWWDK